MKNIRIIVTSLVMIAFGSSAAVAATKEYLVQIKNNRFVPAQVEIPANQKFRLVIENLDKTLEEFESDDLRKEKLVGAGKKIKIPVKGLKPGQYKFYGDFHQKTAKGVIIVK